MPLGKAGAVGSQDGGEMRELRRLPTQGAIDGKLARRVRDVIVAPDHVGDFNQVLYYGGIFAYPELVDAPTGKLRLQFESNPVAFITEKVGGRGSTGTESILDVEPTSIDQRVPTYVGNTDLINKLEQSMKS